MIITKDYILNNYDVDCNHHFSTNRLLLFLQDIAQYQSEQSGIDEEYLTKNNCAWILVKYDIDILKYPKYREKIRIETYPVGSKFAFWFRQFNVYGESGDTIATIKSCWMLFDINTRKPIKMSQEMIVDHGFDKIKNKILLFDIISKIKNITHQETYHVHYTDIDTNHHVNNCVYLNWAINTIPLDVLNNHQMSKIEIVFKKECYIKNIVTSNVELSKNNNGYICNHEILNETEELLCHLRTTWQ